MDTKTNYLPFTRPTLDEETIQGVADVLRSGWITSGPMVEQFEKGLTEYLGGKRPVRTFLHATGAMEECLVMAGIGPGDEVIVPAMTFAATANVVVRVGAKPVLVDVDLRSRSILMAQAVGTEYKGRRIGSFGDIAVFSFHANKNLTTIEGAAVAMSTPEEAKRLEILRFHGINKFP